MTRWLSCIATGVAILVLSSGVASAETVVRDVPGNEREVLLSYAPVAKRVTPAVVNIYAKRRVALGRYSAFAGDPFFQQFFGRGAMPRERMVASLGSGVVVEGNLVVTSHHVVEGGEGIVVALSDGREFPAKIEVSDPTSDLALLTVETKGEALPPLSLADSDAIEVGDLVLAVGNPFGVGQTVTTGIVSALARPAAGVSDYQFFIQTDAAINPGNSGGALTDMQGKLIGINTAIYSKTGGSNGIGFAIPSNMVAALIRNRQPGGSLLRPWLGASYQRVDGDKANALGMDKARGALLGALYEGGPAKEAGLTSGDVIVKLGDADIVSAEALKFRIAVSPLGEPIPVTVWRQGREVALSLTFAAPPEDPPRDRRTLKGPHPLQGMSVVNLSPRVASDYNLPVVERGVVVADDGGNGALDAGDRILYVNGARVTSTAQLETLLQKRPGGWKIVFQRGDEMLTYTVVR